jgi:uncharacterized protein (DUF433 family)
MWKSKRSVGSVEAGCKGEGIGEQVHYKHLMPKRGSCYRQLYVGRRIRAELIYRETVGLEPLTPEQVAREYNISIEAVHEAIDYSVRNKDLLDAERADETAGMKAAGRNRWPYAPKDYRSEE